MGLYLCLASFAVTLLLASRSLALGINSVLTVGYLYGIVRANYLDTYSHFIFDGAVLGCYLSLVHRPPSQAARDKGRDLQRWVYWLLAWVAAMFLVPFQHPLIQLVGLRGNAFLVPFILLGAWLSYAELGKVIAWVAVLNLVAFGFALAEYWWGVPAFYPLNSVTRIIYNSNDVAKYTALRIPACFTMAHAYAGTMVVTIPFLMGGFLQPGQGLWKRVLFAAGTAAAILGVFFTATRVGVVLLLVLLLVTTFSRQLRAGAWLGWLLILISIGYVVSKEERLQRFLSLQDTDAVLTRIEGSVNMNFLELLVKYPMGNGLGAGGTSIPYFLESLITDPVGMENEYSRILLEQGLPGLILWVCFVVWLMQRPAPPPSYPLHLGWRLMWYCTIGSFLMAVLGTGLMTAIPHTCLLFLMVGFIASPPVAPVAKPRPLERSADRKAVPAKVAHASP